MSRGPGRCQRRILKLVSGSPRKRLDRRQLEEVLVGEGYTESNILRAVRGLARDGYVRFADEHCKADSYVSLPPETKRLTEEEIGELLKEINEKEERHVTRTRPTSTGDPAHAVRESGRTTLVGGFEASFSVRGPR